MPYYRYQFSFGHEPTSVVKNLLITMGAVFLFQMVAENWFNMSFIFGLVPLLVWHKYYLWQLFTYIFLHGGLFHLLFNLLALWMFGGELERLWGSKRFLRYFFFCGIGAGITTVLLLPNQLIPVIGASGAIYGILLAYGWLFPNRPIYIYFLFPIPAKYFVVIFGLIELFSSLGQSGGGIAHLTHVGGLLFGLLYMGIPALRRKIRREYYKRKLSPKDPNDRNYYH